MTAQPIRYAIIRLQPHIETEEFANVGIVLVAPRIGYLDFRIETNRTGRYTRFFDRLKQQTVRGILKGCEHELERIRTLAGYDPKGQQRLDLRADERAEHLFAALTKDREGIINYSDVRLAVHSDPELLLKELFDLYVTRAFVDHEYPEGRMEQAFRDQIRRLRLLDAFKPREYDDGLYPARFPFVGVRDGEEIVAVKPLFLGQEDPKRILEHANKWSFAVNRLRSRLPRSVMFAVKGPEGGELQERAFHEAVAFLRHADVMVFDAEGQALAAATSHLQ